MLLLFLILQNELLERRSTVNRTGAVRVFGSTPGGRTQRQQRRWQNLTNVKKKLKVRSRLFHGIRAEQFLIGSRARCEPAAGARLFVGAYRDASRTPAFITTVLWQSEAECGVSPCVGPGMACWVVFIRCLSVRSKQTIWSTLVDAKAILFYFLLSK